MPPVLSESRPAFSVARTLRDDGLRLALTVIVTLQVLDVLSTITGLALGLPELNPLTTAILHHFGWMGLAIQKVPAVIALVLGAALLPRRMAMAATWAVAYVMAFVIASNLHHLLALVGPA